MANQLDELINCPICFEKFVNPKILPCHHTFCDACVIKMEKGHCIECPMDRKVFEITLVKSDFQKLQVIDVFMDLQTKIVNSRSTRIRTERHR